MKDIDNYSSLCITQVGCAPDNVDILSGQCLNLSEQFASSCKRRRLYFSASTIGKAPQWKICFKTLVNHYTKLIHSRRSTLIKDTNEAIFHSRECAIILWGLELDWRK